MKQRYPVFQTAEMFVSSPCSTVTQRSSLCLQHFQQVDFSSFLNYLPPLVQMQATLLNSRLVFSFSLLPLCTSGFYKVPWATTSIFLDTTSFSSSLAPFSVPYIAEAPFLKAHTLSCHLPLKNLALISPLDVLKTASL